MKLAVLVACCLLLVGTHGLKWPGKGGGPMPIPKPLPYYPHLPPYYIRDAELENTRMERADAEQPEAAEGPSGQVKRKRRGWRVHIKLEVKNKKK